MVYQLYIDSLFLINLCIYFLLLNLMSLLKSGKISKLRLAMAALSGAGVSCVILFIAANFKSSGFLMPVLTYGLPVVIMTAIVNKSLKAMILLKDGLLLYIMSFILGGMMDFLKAHVSFLNTYEIEFWLIICLAIVCTFAITYVISKWKAQHTDHFYEIRISLKEGSEANISITALCDSGNSLIDPYSKKSVSVIEKAALGLGEINENPPDGYRLIPFRSVGEERGLMECVRAYSVSMKGRDGCEIKKTDVILGLYDGKLSQNNKYKMLLHPDWVA